MKQHDNHVAAYHYRQSALADAAKSAAYESELMRRYEVGLWLSKGDTRTARRLVRERQKLFVERPHSWTALQSRRS